ncbi:MAG TPA: ABC transporter permease [Puia sp.]|jgi:putative ABC transport system permease protein|nr:ABC transporter permease [Puia sp.]
MLKNFFKVAFRNLLRNKAFSIINISGLVIGMASAILILFWIQNEMSYDRFHKDQDRLYEVWGNDVYDGKIQSGIATPEAMAPVLKNDVPQIEKVSRYDWGNNYLFTVGDKSLKAQGNLVDPDFLSIFSFPLLKGDEKTVLNDPYSIVLTEKLAKKIFGNEDPMGKVIKIENDENYKVTGVLKDLPNNTGFDFEWLMSYVHKTMKGYIDNDWTDVAIRTYVKLKPNTTFAAANEKIKNVIVQHSGGRAKTTEFLYPISKMHLYSNFENGVPVGGLITRVKIFSIIAILILLIACINFMNLSTARSEKRAKEVGIRKVVGARKGSLIGQFLGESILMAFIAGSFSIIVVQICLPAFNQLVQKQLFIDYQNIYFWLLAVGFILFTGVVAGSYPAFFLSAFKPVSVLKGTFKKINALVTPRKVLVIMQFTFAISLIICTLIITQQIKYAQQRETGYNKKNLGFVYMQGDVYTKYQLIKNELLNSGVASSVTRTSAPLTQNWSSGMSMNWEGKDPNTKIQINRYTEDADLVKTAGIQLVQGRDIDAKIYPSDSTACLISEAAVKAMKFKNPIGQEIFDDPVKWHVVGVIKDFILESPYETIKPFMVKGPKYGGSIMSIKLSDANTTAQNLAGAEKIFKKYSPVYPFEFHFVDEEYARKFTDEQLTGTLASLFSALTIFISCLGLFGLATYMAENRIKEIGVRKVLGASVSSITTLLSKDFLKLVALAFLIAAPIAWWTMSSWLQNYNYRIDMNWLTFLLAGVIALSIALLTVSYQSIRAAIANPVKSLRTE